jgi:hypothetical protein
MDMEDIVSWLLDGEPWVRYRTRVDLLGEPEDSPAVAAARAEMTADPRIRALIAEFDGWETQIVNSHRSAGLLMHKLAFLADIGMRITDPDIERIVGIVLRHRTDDGIVQVLANIPVHFGGTGLDCWCWAPCDAPVILYALAKTGMDSDPSIISALTRLTGLARENGWPCAVSPELGKFRGPGGKNDPCPYATLYMLKADSQIAGLRDSDAVRAGTACLLGLWERSRETHPYMFFMGTDFRKLKAPMVWYDILHVADTLSHFKWVMSDPRFGEMTDVIRAAAGPDGRYTPQSEWKAWNGWDFGQKKEPSRWLTFLALRVLRAEKTEL